MSKSNTATEARTQLQALGWIPPRSEYFRHLPPPKADVWLGTDTAASAPIDPHDGWSLDIADGNPSSVQVQWLDAMDGAQRKALFQGTAEPGPADSDRFTWAHRALCQRGLRLQVTAPADLSGPASTHIVLQRRPQTLLEAPTLVIEVAPRAHCILQETHLASQLPEGALVQNLQIHILLGAGSSLRHVRTVTPQAPDQVAHEIHVVVGADASYRQILVGSGSQYHLQRTDLDLAADRSDARVGAALFVTGAGSNLDQQVEALHGGVHTRSDVEAMMLGSGRARGVLNAMCRMAQGAQDARALQRLSGIPTGGGQPRIILRPHMEICHDEVEAEHGATWGALPEDALFYARQRGLDDQTARALIVRGMLTALLAHTLDEDLDLVSELGVNQVLEAAVARHMAGSGTNNAPTAQS